MKLKHTPAIRRPQVGFAAISDSERYITAEVLRMALKSWLGNPAPGMPKIRDQFQRWESIDPTEAADAIRRVVIQMDGCGDPKCPGWAHFNLNGDREEIERCSDCDVFEDDIDATDAHNRHCKCGAGAHGCVRCHECSREFEDSDERYEHKNTVICEYCNDRLKKPKTKGQRR